MKIFLSSAKAQKGSEGMNIAILGFGVVGSGVAEVLKRNGDSIAEVAGTSFALTRILDIRDPGESEYASLFTKKFDDILNDDSVKIVVETMGGVKPAFEFVSACLKKGKHVVSSNKELVATRGFELLELARENNVNFMFEASVGGGIPIIRPISRCLAGNKITEIAGILNGTSNFILTKMIVDGMTFADALKLAQDKGYAEKDPTADVEGLDAMRKICILASLAFGHHVYPDGVYSEGISRITLEDVAYAASYDSVIKLIARTKCLDNGKILVMVSPCFISNDSMLSGVNGVFNACLVRGDATGDVLMYGKGAGSLATASAVVGDIIDCAANDKERKAFGWGDKKEDYLESYLECETALYVRGTADDIPSVKAKLADTFGAVTYLSRDESPDNEIAFVIPKGKEIDIRKALPAIGVSIMNTVRIADY